MRVSIAFVSKGRLRADGHAGSRQSALRGDLEPLRARFKAARSTGDPQSLQARHNASY